jgi:hypothetical protein
MSDRCVNIDDKDFKVLQKEVNINPYILATKVKLWQDKQENEADKNRLPTAQELNIASVFVVVEKKAAPVETPQPTQEEQLKNEIQKLQSQRKDIEKQIESLDKEISKSRNPLKKITKRKKLRKLEYELDSVVYKESLLSKERNQNKAEEDVVKQNPVTEEEVLPQVNEESERLIINNSTEFNNFPAELRYELIVHHIRKYGSGLVVADLSNMNEVLANVSTGVIEAIESSLKKASYANIINNFNKTKNAPKSEPIPEEVTQDVESKIEDKTGVTITGGTKQNLKKPRTKVKVGDVLSVNVRYGEENIAEGYEYSVDVLNKDGEVIGALPYESKEAKEVLASDNPNQAKVTIVYVSPISSDGVIGFSATVSVDEAADEVEEKKFKQLNITSFEKLIPGLTDVFTREETQEFKKEYNNINSAEERADYLANLEDRVKQKKLENENAENGLTKEQAQELIDKVNANTKILRENRKFPNSKVGFNKNAVTKARESTTIPRNIVEDFIATDNTFSSRRKLKEQMLNDLFNFYSLSKQYNPTNTFANTSQDNLYDAVRAEMNNQYRDRRLSRNVVIKTNNFLRSKNFPFKVEYDFFNSPRLVPVAKKAPVSKPKQTDVVNVTFKKASDFALSDENKNVELIALALAIDALGPSGEYGLWNDRTRDVGVRRESGQEGYIFDRDSKLPKNKTKIYNRVDELADEIYEEIPEIKDDATKGHSLLEDIIKEGSVANMKMRLVREAEPLIAVFEGGITSEQQAYEEAMNEALILEETQFEEASKGVYTDESLNEFYNTLDSYQNSIEYKIEVGAYTGTRESLTDVQKDLYDRAAAEGLYEETEDVVEEEDFDSILAREAQNNLYNVAAKNLQEYGIESFSNPRSLVSEVIKALRNSDVINFNKPLDIINTVLEKQYSSTLSKGQVAEVKRQLIDFINNPSMSFGVYQVLQPIGNIQPGVYTIEISNFNTLAFTNVQALEKPKTTISVDEFINKGAPESVDNFKIIQADQTVINSNLIDTVMNKEDLTSLNESLSDIFSNFTSNISEFDNLEKTDLNNQIIEEFNKCK